MADSLDEMLRQKRLLEQMRTSVPPSEPMQPSEPAPQAYSRFTRTPIYLQDISKISLLDQIKDRMTQPFFQDPNKLPGGVEPTGEYGGSGGDRLHVKYGPQTSPWEVMNTALHEDIHAALIRGLGGYTPPVVYSKERDKAIKGFRTGDPRTKTGPRAGMLNQELPAYVGATPYALSGLSDKDREEYIDNLEWGLRSGGDPYLGALYRRMTESYGGTSTDPRPKFLREEKKKK